MNWHALLENEVKDSYGITLKLVDKVDDAALGWRPAGGANWMTTGQVLHHLTNACGTCFKGFITGDWGFPADVDPSSMPHEEMMPPAEKLPTVAAKAEARAMIEKDYALALEMLKGVSAADLADKPAPAPWDPTPMPLGRRLLQMVQHLTQHKGQLFYYLKLQGQPVNTMDLWS